jgi:hypothetical protein
MLFIPQLMHLQSDNMTNTIDNLKHICSEIETEVSILKGTLESNYNNQCDYSPMMTFFDSFNKRQIAIVIPSADNIENTIIRLTEALHLFVALSSDSVIISMKTKIIHNDQYYDALNVFLLSQTHAWQLTFPFTVDDSNVITWHEDLNEIVGVDDIDYDANIKEMVTAFYYVTHLPDPAFSVSEIISYLSSQNATIKLLEGQKISYLDFANNYI